MVKYNRAKRGKPSKEDSFSKWWWALPIAIGAGVVIKAADYFGNKAYDFYKKRKNGKEKIPEGDLEKKI
ncbi:hypothetical protein ACFLZZ_03390 [Nanoarchaeota archaeon]